MRQLKLLIADDHRLMVDATRIALEREEDLEVVGTTHPGVEVLPLVAQKDPDVVGLDLRMPEMDGLTILERLRERHPKVKTVVLSGSDEPEVVRSALERGASAFIMKHIDPRDLASAIRQAIEGSVYQTFGEPPPREEMRHDAPSLSERERSILQALADGLSNKQIAKQLWLAEQTIKFHLTNIYRKLGVSSRTEAVRAAYQQGLLESPLLEDRAN